MEESAKKGEERKKKVYYAQVNVPYAYGRTVYIYEAFKSTLIVDSPRENERRIHT